MGFSREEYWSGLPFYPPGVLPDRGMGATVSYNGRQVLLSIAPLGSPISFIKIVNFVDFWIAAILTGVKWYLIGRSKSLQAINAGEGVEKREPSYTVGGNAN